MTFRILMRLEFFDPELTSIGRPQQGSTDRKVRPPGSRRGSLSQSDFGDQILHIGDNFEMLVPKDIKY